MKRTYKFFWIILIALIPLLPSSGWNFSIDVSDVGFNMNQYRFCFTDMDSTYLPLFLTNILGGCLLKVFGILHIPAYIGMETAWAAVCFYLCFLSYRLYVRYREDALILPALAFAMVLAKCNFHFFIYNTAMTKSPGCSFLHRHFSCWRLSAKYLPSCNLLCLSFFFMIFTGKKMWHILYARCYGAWWVF